MTPNETEEESYSPRPTSTNTTNLKRGGALLELGRANENLNETEGDDDDQRFFDSRDYRCCFSIFHAKIGTFVFCTWVFHEIVLGTIYLFSQLENAELTTRMAILLACRFVQLPCMAILYVGLWRHRRFLLLPFALTQLTLGTFVDISSLMMLLEQLDQSGSFLLFGGELKWLNFALPLLLYTLLTVCLMWVLYKCFIFLKARNAHDEKRRLEKEQLQLHILQKSFSSGGCSIAQDGSPTPDLNARRPKNGLGIGNFGSASMTALPTCSQQSSPRSSNLVRDDTALQQAENDEAVVMVVGDKAERESLI